MIFSIGIQNSWRSWNNAGRNEDECVKTKNDSFEKLQIVIITRKKGRIKLCIESNDTALSLVSLGCSNFKLQVHIFKK